MTGYKAGVNFEGRCELMKLRGSQGNVDAGCSKGACSCGGPLSYTMMRNPEDRTSYPNWHSPRTGQRHTLGYIGEI